MSDNTTQDGLIQEFAALYSPAVNSNYIQLAAAVLVLYDYLLTLSPEVSLIWCGKVNIMKVLFFMNRYPGLIAQYANVFLYFIKPASNLLTTTIRCNAFNYIQDIADALGDTAVYSVFTLRTFAIFGRSRAVLFALAIPALVDVASIFWVLFIQGASALPPQLQVGPFACTFDAPDSLYAGEEIPSNTGLSYSSLGTLVNSISSGIFDALVVIFTVYRTARLAKQSKEVNIHRSLSYILLRDGIIFYTVIFVPIFANIVLNAIVLKGINLDISVVSADFVVIIQAVRIVAVNRLVLSLSYSANAREDSEYRSRTGFEPPLFAANSVLGNIGGLVHSLPDDSDALHFEGAVESLRESSNKDEVNLEAQTGFQAGGSSGSGVDTEEASVCQWVVASG